MRFTYLGVDLLTVLVPFLFSFHPRIRFDRWFRVYVVANLISATVFIAWDILFTRLGVWGFNPHYVLGIYIAGLPIEEVLFFFCIPFACVFTYYCISQFSSYSAQPWIWKSWSTILGGALLLLGFMYLDKRYTATTFISIAVLILVLQWILKCRWLGTAYIVYLILILPFLVVNGILTGTGPDEPIVWYNNAENLNLRLLSIPVEDFFYGFFLFLLTAFFFERGRSRVLKT